MSTTSNGNEVHSGTAGPIIICSEKRLLGFKWFLMSAVTRKTMWLSEKNLFEEPRCGIESRITSVITFLKKASDTFSDFPKWPRTEILRILSECKSGSDDKWSPFYCMDCLIYLNNSSETQEMVSCINKEVNNSGNICRPSVQNRLCSCLLCLHPQGLYLHINCCFMLV